MIAIIDYGVGNVRAFMNIYHELRLPCRLAQTPEDLNNAKKIILPGVGAFDHAMEQLHNSGLIETLNKLVVQDQIPILGICVGMQMLASSSAEGKLSGLGWIPGQVERFDIDSSSFPLPHMGWNNIDACTEAHPLLDNLTVEPRFYFLHSFHFIPNDPTSVVATAFYGQKFTAIVARNNVYGMQCHPEKSHQNGIRFLENFGVL